MSVLSAPPRVRVGRLLLAGGGTAGHVNPALAVLPEVDAECLWVGSVGGREEPLVRRAGLPFRGVPTGAVVGRGPVALARSLLRNARGIFAARAALRAFRPDVVLATGGYVSVPVALAARSLGVPSAVFLPDVEPGLAVKALARIVDRVACTLEETRAFLPPEKVVPTGYPVRADLRAYAGRPDGRAAGRAALDLPADGPVVLVMGGSSGARSINRAVFRALPRLVEQAHLLHLAGPEGAEEAAPHRAALPAALQERYRPFAYLHEEMGAAFAAADLVVCRAGASILGELPAFGRAGVLIPGDFAGGHQRHNADALVRIGAARRLDDARLADERALPDAVEEMLADPARLRAMGEAARALDRPDAPRRIAELLAALAGGRR